MILFIKLLAKVSGGFANFAIVDNEIMATMTTKNIAIGSPLLTSYRSLMATRTMANPIGPSPLSVSPMDHHCRQQMDHQWRIQSPMAIGDSNCRLHRRTTMDAIVAISMVSGYNGDFQ